MDRMTTATMPAAWRVTIIDDSAEDRAEVRRLLLEGSDRRYEFTEAETGAAGVRAVLQAASPPDCVVLDYGLPDADAPELLAELASPAGGLVCPVVVLTGRASSEIGHAVLKAGAHEFVGKGWMTRESMTRAVESASERWGMVRDRLAAESALARRNERLLLLSDAAAVLVATDDPEHLLEDVYSRAAAYIGADVFMSCAYDPVRDDLRLTAALGLDPAMRQRRARLTLGESFCGMCARERSALYVPDVSNDPRPEASLERALGARVYAGYPLLAGDRLLGTLCFASRTKNRFEPDELEFAQSVSYHVAATTERLRSERELRAANDTFRHLVDESPFGIYTVDADFRLVQVSAGAQTTFRNVRPLLDRDFAEVMRVVWPEPFASEVIDRFHHTLATGEPYSAPPTVSQRVDTDDVVAYDWRIERLALPDGRLGVVCHFYDLSERRQWELALEESQRELQRLADNTPDILTRFDRDLRYVFVNLAIEKATGRAPTEILGKSNRDLGMPADLCDLWDAAVRTVFEQRQPSVLDFAFEGFSGTRQYESRLVPEFGADGSVDFVLGVTREVTETRAAESATLASEARLQIALSAASAGAWAWHILTGQVTWSPETYALYGYELADGMPLRADWEARIHPDDRTLRNSAVTAALEGRAPEFRSEFRVVHPDQGTRWLLGVGKVEFGPMGEPIQMAGINLDITERKLLEQELLRGDERKDEFLATLAHELRNPLAPIRNALQLMNISPAGGPAASKARDIIERQLGHMVRLVDDLMDVSRINSGRIELQQARLPVQAVLEHALETSVPFVEAGAHTLTVTVPDEPVWVYGDLTRLVQVVANLLNNAAKYTPSGGRISLSMRVEDGDTVITVSDNGSGMSADLLPKVFDMFIQEAGNRERAQGGLGIGLSLARKLLAMHGGSITAESPGLGFGSTFVVRLPSADIAATPETDDVPPGGTLAPQKAGRRVLVVDDNVDGAESLTMLLDMFGHQARAVHDGPAALTAADSFRPDVVFLDIGLPGMNGYEVAKRLRSEPALESIVLIALTGWGSEDDRRKSKEAGFDHHLVKPVDAGQVRRLLDRMGED